jgi:hypothetical protein
MANIGKWKNKWKESIIKVKTTLATGENNNEN